MTETRRERAEQVHSLLSQGKCPECEKKAVVKDKNRPQLIRCECGHVFHTYPST